jgi:hypothetical protein
MEPLFNIIIKIKNVMNYHFKNINKIIEIIYMLFKKDF